MATTKKSQQLFQKAIPEIVKICLKKSLPFKWSKDSSYFDFHFGYLHTDNGGRDCIWLEKPNDEWIRFEDIKTFLEYIKIWA